MDFEYKSKPNMQDESGSGVFLLSALRFRKYRKQQIPPLPYPCSAL